MMVEWTLSELKKILQHVEKDSIEKFYFTENEMCPTLISGKKWVPMKVCRREMSGDDFCFKIAEDYKFTVLDDPKIARVTGRRDGKKISPYSKSE